MNELKQMVARSHDVIAEMDRISHLQLLQALQYDDTLRDAVMPLMDEAYVAFQACHQYHALVFDFCDRMDRGEFVDWQFGLILDRCAAMVAESLAACGKFRLLLVRKIPHRRAMLDTLRRWKGAVPLQNFAAVYGFTVSDQETLSDRQRKRVETVLSKLNLGNVMQTDQYYLDALQSDSAFGIQNLQIALLSFMLDCQQSKHSALIHLGSLQVGPVHQVQLDQDLQELTVQVKFQMKNGMQTDAYFLVSLRQKLDLVRGANHIMRYCIVNKPRNVTRDAVIQLLLNLSQLELRMRERIGRLTTERNELWQHNKDVACGLLVRLHMYFTDTEANQSLANAFGNAHQAVNALDVTRVIASNRQLLQLIESLQQAAQFHQLEANLQLRHMVEDTISKLQFMHKLLAVSDAEERELSVVGEFSYGVQFVRESGDSLKRLMATNAITLDSLNAMFEKLRLACESYCTVDKVNGTGITPAANAYYTSVHRQFVVNSLKMLPEIIMQRVVECVRLLASGHDKLLMAAVAQAHSVCQSMALIEQQHGVEVLLAGLKRAMLQHITELFTLPTMDKKATLPQRTRQLDAHLLEVLRQVTSHMSVFRLLTPTLHLTDMWNQLLPDAQSKYHEDVTALLITATDPRTTEYSHKLLAFSDTKGAKTVNMRTVYLLLQSPGSHAIIDIIHDHLAQSYHELLSEIKQIDTLKDSLDLLALQLQPVTAIPPNHAHTYAFVHQLSYTPTLAYLNARIGSNVRLLHLLTVPEATNQLQYADLDALHPQLDLALLLFTLERYAHAAGLLRAPQPAAVKKGKNKTPLVSQDAFDAGIEHLHRQFSVHQNAYSQQHTRTVAILK